MYIVGLSSWKTHEKLRLFEHAYNQYIAYASDIILTWLTQSLKSYINTSNEAFHMFWIENHTTNMLKNVNLIIQDTILKGIMF